MKSSNNKASDTTECTDSNNPTLATNPKETSVSNASLRPKTIVEEPEELPIANPADITFD